MNFTDQFSFKPKDIGQFLPFENGSYGTLKFSFRQLERSGFSSIGLFPESFMDYQKDLSIREQLHYSNSTGEFDGKRVKDGSDILTSILDTMPYIQIREIAQDNRMQEIGYLFSAFETGWDLGKKVADQDGKTLKMLGAIVKEFFTQVFLGDKSVFLSNPLGGLEIKGLKDEDYLLEVDKQKKLLFNLPYMLYYMLIGKVALNYYEFPCDMSKLEDQVNSPGWGDQDNQFGLVGDVGTASIVGKLLKFAGAQFSVALQPRWNPIDTAPQTVTVQVNLFNDTYKKALNNFLMINSLIPGAMSWQYGILKNAPNVYDVKIPGFTRMFMCSLNVTVRYKGVSRIPSDTFLTELTKPGILNQDYGLTKDNIRQKGLIRIPDVYEVTLQFTSLLPHNLNNYMYYFSTNEKLEVDTEKGNTGIFDGMTNAVEKVADKFGEITSDNKLSCYASIDNNGTVKTNDQAISENIVAKMSIEKPKQIGDDENKEENKQYNKTQQTTK